MRWWHTIRVCILTALTAASVSACRTVERAAEVRTEYRTVYQRDSIWVDCTDTLYVVERGDTVRITETKTVREYRYKVLMDTVAVTDTVTVYKERMGAAAAVGTKKIKRWPWFVAGFACGVFIIFAARILVRIYLHR